jgi:hypothetical protein
MTEHFAGASLTLTGDADLRPERFQCVCRGLQTWSEWEKGKEGKRDLMDGPPSSYNRAAAVICFLLNPVVPGQKERSLISMGESQRHCLLSEGDSLLKKRG